MRRQTLRLWILLCFLILPAVRPVPATAQQAPDETAAAVSEQEATTEVASAPEEVPPLEPATTPVPADARARSIDEAEKEGAAGQGFWTDILLPMWQRLATAVPILLKALALLAAFWLAAVLLGAGVTKLLSLTNLDERAVRDLGLEKMLVTEDGRKRSLEKLSGAVVKWIVLLFGFVAFFDALSLTMVAGPLQGVLNTITGAVPSLLKAALILLAYWLVASLLKVASTKGLQVLGLDDRVGKYLPPREIKGEMVTASHLIGRLLFYIVLLFGIPPFLDALGQQALVAPLRDMLAKTLTFLPNVFAAVLLIIVGRIIAAIVREIVTNFLAAVGLDRLAEKFGFEPSENTRRLSEIVGTIAFFFIIIPVIVAAVDALAIEAISMPVRATLQQVLATLPLIFVALVVIAVGYYIASAVRNIVSSFLSGTGFDQLPQRLGLKILQPKEGGPSLSSLGGTVVMAIILLLTAEQALATMKLQRLSSLVGELIRYLPNLVVGLVIILVALSLGAYVAKLVRAALEGSSYQGALAMVAQYAVVFLGVSMGLVQLGVGQDIIRLVVAAVTGGSALAAALAFGLGGTDRAREMINKTRSTS